MDAFRGFCQKYRQDPETKKNRFAILQAEDELAAIGMVIGAGWAGARAFTSTSGPGISLMNEFIGLAYYAEVPAVIFDVQRTGPSTGMPTRTQQGDLMMCAYASHGDTRHICLYPADPREAFELAAKAFDFAERFQTPVFVLSDLDIGMNDWMVPKLAWDDSYKPDRGKVLTAEQLEQAKNFYRYLDVDGDGIPYRTLPGAPEGRVLHARLRPQQVRRLHRGRRGVRRGRRPHRPQDPARDEGRCRRRSSARRPARSSGMLTVGGCHAACIEALDLLAQGRHRARLHARARLPVRRRRGEVHRVARAEVRRRAEPRRAAAQPADARDRRGDREDGVGPLLRRVPDERAPRDFGSQGEDREGGVGRPLEVPERT